MNSSIKSISLKTFSYICFVLISVRLWMGAITPLTETTEARYGEIARKMLEVGNWVNLLNTYDSPFWAKPPLYAWLSAGSMQVFGINEFAVRLPSLIISGLTAWLVYAVTAREFGKDKAIIATLILISSAGFIVASNTVMTDPSLLLATTLSLFAWWKNHKNNQSIWAHTFFAGIGLGLLAKGPLAIVLVGMPIFLYLMIYGEWKRFFRELPWITGLFISVVLPGIWYFLAELRTPGFLEYFLLGEHVYRFIKPGWTGDLYGNAHIQPHGMIIVYAFIALLPWTPIWIGQVIKSKSVFVTDLKENSFKVFLILWLSSQLFFFCLPANIIWPYYLPMAPAFAILCALEFNWRPTINRRIIYSGICLIIALLLTTSYLLKKQPAKYLKSGKSVVEEYIKESSAHPGKLFYFSNKRLFSIEFYSSGKAQWIKSPTELNSLLKNETADYIIVSREQINDIPVSIRNQLIIENDYEESHLHLMLLLKEKSHP